MKKFISLLLTIVLICSSLPMCVGAEETTSGYRLEYDRIGKDTFKIYVIAENETLKNSELRIYYDNLEVISYKLYPKLQDKYFVASLTNHVPLDKYAVFIYALEKETYFESVYIGEVEVKLLSGNQTIRLVDGGDNTDYDEITLDMSTEWDGSTPRPIPGEDDQPTPTWNPEWTPVPTAPPTEAPTETPEPTPEPNYETGDVDGNGSINAQDALMVLKQAAKLGNLTDGQFKAADVDDNNNVNATDALNILKYAAKIIVRFVFEPEENIRILGEYIEENGTVNENGNKQTLMDYVALGDSRGTVEYDSFEYDAEKDWIIYVYERVADYPEDCLKFTVTIKKATRTEVKIEWKDIVGNEVYDLSCESSFFNDKISLDSNFEADLTSDYLNGINDFTGKKQSIWQAEMKELYNSYVHSALISMEDYFSKTVIMYLPDIYESYKYNAQKKEDLLYPCNRSDKTIKNNLNSLSTRLDENGIKVDGFAYFEELIEYETSDGAAYAYAYVEKNTETNDVYFYLDAYHIESDMAVFVYVQPYANRNVFVDVVLYEANGDQYEVTKEVQSMISSMDFEFDGEYEYQCVYPENGDITAEEKSIIDQDVNALIEILDEVLGKNAGLSSYSFGFINY